MNTDHLHQRRAALVQQRAQVTRALSDLKARRSSLTPAQYGDTRAALVKQDERLNQEFIEINEAIRVEHKRMNPDDVTQTLSGACSGKKELVQELSALRDEYAEVAADRSRLRSVRDMSSEFCTKLGTIIRQSINA